MHWTVKSHLRPPISFASLGRTASMSLTASVTRFPPGATSFSKSSRGVLVPTRADSVGAVSDLVGDSTFGLLSGDSSLGFFSGDSDLGFLVGGGTSSSSVAEALSSSLTDASVPLSSPPPSTDFSAVGSPAGVAGDRGASGSGEASALRMGQRLDCTLKAKKLTESRQSQSRRLLCRPRACRAYDLDR